MFLLSVEDLHNNRFKQGWFTLLKFTEKARAQPELVEEMRVFNETKLEKPDVKVFQKVVKAKVVKKAFKKLNLQIGAGDDEDEQSE